MRLAVRLSPGVNRNGIQGWAADADGNPVLKCAVTAAPEKGKANRALVALLAERLGIAKTSIALIRGETDRNKVLEIDVEPEALYRVTGAPPSFS